MWLQHGERQKARFLLWLGLNRQSEDTEKNEEALPEQEEGAAAGSDVAEHPVTETPADTAVIADTAGERLPDIEADSALEDEKTEADETAELDVLEPAERDTDRLEDAALSADVARVEQEEVEEQLQNAPFDERELDEAEEEAIEDIAQEESVEDAPSEWEQDEPFDEGELDDAEEEAIEDIEQEEAVETPLSMQEQERPTKEGFFARLKRSLLKTKQNLGSGFMGLFRGKRIDDELFEELEEQLLIADVGVNTTSKIIASLTEHASRRDLKDAEALYERLKDEMSEILKAVDKPLDVSGHKPFVILMVGVNGVGKTTTIGKLARQFQAQGKSVMLAAGDTFRAAAVEQLQVWGQRNNIPVIAQHTGADSASVIFDAIEAAKARNVDVLIADTAGRLQNKSHLMEELKKIVRVMKKLDEEAPHEIMLTIDASTGQNAISQTKLFSEAVGLTGITLTKLDGTAKGGVIFSVADQFGIPIRYIGVGEGIDDLRPFHTNDFIEALFARED